jgi:hypothetical protein
MIARYPGVHKNLKSVTTHHPRRFKKVWADVEPLLFDCNQHVAAFKDGTIHDWSINAAKRVRGVYRIVRIAETVAEAATVASVLEQAVAAEDEDDGLLIDGKDPLVVLKEEHAKTMAARHSIREI